MTFTAQIKEEILKAPLGGSACERAFLSALIHTAGSLSIGAFGLGFEMTGENEALMRKVSELFVKLFAIKPAFGREESNLRGRYRYTVSCSDARTGKVLERLGILRRHEDGIELIRGIDDEIIEAEGCAESYIKGIFLGSGAVLVPSAKAKGQTRYHLEFSFSSESLAEDFSHLLAQFDFLPKMTERKNAFVVYFKESETISDLLAFLGSSDGVLRLNEIYAERQMRNVINRQSNCQVANIDRTMGASARQCAAIAVIESLSGLEKLPENLQEMARLRKENPTLGTEELGKRTTPPIGKSGANHRLRKLVEIAETLRGGKRL